MGLPRDEYKLITFAQYVDCLEYIINFPNFLRDEECIHICIRISLGAREGNPVSNILQMFTCLLRFSTI